MSKFPTFFIILLFVILLSNQNLTAQTYCASKGNTPWTEWIANVQFGTINNASQKEGYGNFTSQTTDLTKGTSYPLSITQGFSWAADPTNATQQGKAWIDYNKNGTFEASELVASFTRTTATANIAIPQTALTGPTRMRISLKTTGAPTACETFDKGEVEDYIVNITDVATVLQPDLTITNVIAPAFVRVNEPLNVSYRVKNIGNAVGVLSFSNNLSSRKIVSATDPNVVFGLGSEFINSDYRVGFDTLINFSRNIAVNIPAGNYFLEIEADPETAITESNETNNKTRIPIEIRAPVFENQKLRVTAVTGNNRVATNGVLAVNVTIKNNAPIPSLPDSVYIVSWVANTGLGAGAFYSQPYSRNKVAIPAIAANQSITIPASFTMPATLSSNPYAVEAKVNALLEPYFITKQVDSLSNSFAPITGDSAKSVSYNFPILPLATADLVLTGSQINATWDSANPAINVRLRITNNGPDVARNISAQIHKSIFRNGTAPLPSITDFAQTSGGGTLDLKSIAWFNSFSIDFWGWKIPELAAGASIEATFRGVVRTEFAAPQASDFYYKDLSIQPKILYADVLDNAKANDSIVGGYTYRFVRSATGCANDVTPPVYANCPQNINLSISGTRAFASWTPPTATDNCTLASNLGTINPPFSFGLGSTPVVYTATDTKNNTSTCRFDVVLTQSPTTILPDLTFTTGNILNNAVKGGDSLKFNYSLSNAALGGTPANTNFLMQSYISTDNVLSANDLAANPVGIFGQTIAQQVYSNGTTYVTVPTSLAAGTYFLLSKIDATNVITESNEGNNVIVLGSFTVTALPTGSYCAAKGVAPWEYWVANTSFNTINNASDKFKDFATLGYSDYTNLTTTVSKGQSYPLSISPGLSWIGNVPNAYVRAWIDFNNNKTFEANELVLEKTNANPLTANVLVPTTAVTGNVRMRVALKFGAYPTACEAFDRGEVEDYTVNISGGTVTPTCLNRYPIYYAQPDENDCTGRVGSSAATIQGVVNFYGATFADGFSYSLTNDIIRSRKTFQFVKTPPLSSAPASSKFRNCSPPNGWQYFVSNGIGQNERSDDFLDENVNVRVTYWGNPTNPDSIALELDSASVFGINGRAVFKTFPMILPDKKCNPCFENDVTPPVITNCPTTEVIYPNVTVFASTILTIANISITDESCSNSTNSSGRQIQYSVPGVGSTPIIPPGVLTPLSLIAYDSAGNKSVCNFNLRVVLPNQNQPDLTLANLTVPTPSVSQGQILNFKVDVKNVGTASATGNFNIKSYLSTDNVLSANDYQDGAIPTANFAAGLTQPQVAGAMTVNSTVTAGNYYLILKIDADNQITESNENNNVVVSTSLITVTGGTTGGGADLALSITTTPSVFQKFTTQTFKVKAQNVGSQTLTNVKVELKRPALTSNGGSKVTSVGTFQDFCPGGIECSEWTIPSLAAGAMATLDAPFFILDANTPIVVTTKLLNSSPTDGNALNNTASVTISPAAAGAGASVLALSRQKPSQFIPIVVQSIEPTLTDGNVTVRLESIVEKEVSFNMYNTMGKQIFSEKRKVEKGENLLNFDVSDFPQGMYLIAPESSFARNTPMKFTKF